MYFILNLSTNSTCKKLSEPSPKIDFFLGLELIQQDSARTSTAIENLTEKFESLCNKMKIPRDSIFLIDEVKEDRIEK